MTTKTLSKLAIDYVTSLSDAKNFEELLTISQRLTMVLEELNTRQKGG